MALISSSLLLIFAAATPAARGAVIFSPTPEGDSAVAEPAQVPPLLTTPDFNLQPGELAPLGFGQQSTEPEISVAPSSPSDSPALRSSQSGSRRHGKVYSFWRGQGAAECSGALISGRQRPVVLSAAHCVFLLRPGQRPRKADYLIFIPALKPGRAPFGSYRIAGKDIYVKPGVAEEIKANRFSNDWAFLRLKNSKQAQRYVGADGAVFNPRRLQQVSVSLIGYPGSRYNGSGQKKLSCDAEILGLDRTQPSPQPFVSSCGKAKMARGVSGGGWRWPSSRAARVLSLTSYRNTYVINKRPTSLMAGIQLDSRAHRAYLNASG